MNNSEHRYQNRRNQGSHLKNLSFDALVVGGGISGAAIYHRLCKEGYKVLLVEQGDFASGTSQASAMWVWGGLLFLEQLRFSLVHKLSLEREHLLHDFPEKVCLNPIRYLITKNRGRGRFIPEIALYLYWLLGHFKRHRPRFEKTFPELQWLQKRKHASSLLYEEARMIHSDARFVTDLILTYQSDTHIPMNYSSVEEGDYDPVSKKWRIELRDHILDLPIQVETKWVINAAGCWVNQINQKFGIDSSWKHVFSKGVHIGLPRYPNHTTSLIFDDLQDSTLTTLIPWGPVSLWGNTETLIHDLTAGYHADVGDIRFLLTEWNGHVKKPVGAEDIVSIRCGVRPLAVPKDYQEQSSTFDISRNYHLEWDPKCPWISVYGGKFSGALGLANSLVHPFKTLCPPTSPSSSPLLLPPLYSDRWPGLEDPVLSAQYAAEHEFCWTLDDYLRRRTNISQWVSRMGLGKNRENIKALSQIAQFFPGKKGSSPEKAVQDYLEKEDREFDSLLKKV